MEILGLNFDFISAKGLLSFYAAQFAIFTLVAYVAKGRDALNWNKDLLRSVRVNWAFIATNALIAPIAAIWISASAAFYDQLGVPMIPAEVWAGMPVIVPALVAVLLIDFIDYWCHRFKHVSFLWPMHGVHHSDTALNYTSWLRAHVVELVFTNLVLIFTATWLGAHPGAVIAVAVLRAMHQQYVHMDIDWSHGRFEGWLVSPRFHRWHHANAPEAYDKNFANILPLWDRLFGTYYCPGPCTVGTGFPGSPGDNYVQLMLFPFKEWGRMIGKAVRKTPV